MEKRRTALYLILLVLVAAGAGYMVSQLLARTTTPQLAAGTALPEARSLPAFALTDHTGAAFDNSRLAGHPSLLFFGFTHCPDVCPMTLAVMAQLLRDPDLEQLQAVFVSVDPQRDDTRAMGLYVNAFGGGITGVRGEEAQLAPLLQGMGVAHDTLPLPGGGYTVDHSAALYYLNEQGHWSAVFTPPFDLATLRQDLITLLASDH